MLRTLCLVAMVVLSAGACTPKGRSGATPSARANGSARSVLAAYLDATFTGHHARGWSLLTRADRARTSRATYVEEQRNLSATRAQLDALGKSKHAIRAVSERGDRATATVVLTSGLGRESLRFVLRRERGQWRVDYGASWSSD